ncbi:hypothetical protein HY085_03010 [Candidatus Gottesmanbacteria bacterium]|nr:hypothetical protein [Candidatus Gottesmanbacteria bacterium]
MILKIIVVFLILSLNYLKPQAVTASTLPWRLVYPNTRESTYIKTAPSNVQITYASVRKWTDIDILKSTDSGNTWQSIKNNLPAAEDVNWISIYPTNPDVLAISVWGNGGGIFISDNGGQVWTKVFDSQNPRAVEIDPTNANIIWAGIGGNNTSNTGVYKSIDKGVTWNKITSLGSGNNSQINIDPKNHDRIFLDVGPNFYRSIDGGNNWTLLPIQDAGSTGTIFDINDPNTLYAGTFGQKPGVYKTINNGDSWVWKNNGLSVNVFHLSQNEKGDLYLSHGGGQIGLFWRSLNGGDSWESIGEPSWAGRNIWGNEPYNGRVLVSVEGLGIFWADTVEQQKVAVFIPGFGGSWSYKGLIENQATTYDDWQLMPLFTDEIYQPLLTALNPLIFAYDFRKSVADSAASLNNFLTDKAAGKKANIVAHSMGGLIARHCLEKIPGCAAKINKIVTSGTPHQGTLTAYDFWEAGKIDENDILLRVMEEVALHVTAWPDLLDKDIVQKRFPGVKDLLPNSYTVPATVSAVLTTQSGNSLPTHDSFTPTSRSVWEKTLGLWADGKPGSYVDSLGDGTVTKTSAEITAAAVKSYGVEHKDYFKNLDSLTDILNAFGLTGTLDLTVTRPTSILTYIIHSPAAITATVGANLNGKVIFITDPIYKNYPVTVTGLGNGNYSLDSFYFTASVSARQTKTGVIQNNQVVNINWEDNVDDLLNSLRKKIAASSNRQLKLIEAAIIKAVKNKDINTLEKNYLEINRLISVENQGNPRRELLAINEEFLLLINKINTAVPSVATVNAEIARTQKSVDLKLAKTSLSLREAANLQLAQDNLSKAQQNLNYKGLLLARGTIPLVN